MSFFSKVRTQISFGRFSSIDLKRVRIKDLLLSQFFAVLSRMMLIPFHTLPADKS